MDFYAKCFAILLLWAFLVPTNGIAAPLKVSGRVAIIDLDAIAKTFGRDKVIAENVKMFVEKNEKAINEKRKQLKVKLEIQKKKMGKNPKPEEKKKYTQMASQAERELRNDVAQTRRGMAALRAKLVREFRNEVQPLAIKIAGRKGFSLVLLKQPGMLYIDPNVDISNDVAKMMAAEATGKK